MWEAEWRYHKNGNVLITVRDKDKPEILPIAKKLQEKQFNIYATSGTAKYLSENGVKVNTVEKIWEGQNSILELMHSGKLNFIVNTPTKGKVESRDGFRIRRTAVECKIPCFTAIDTVNALVDVIEHNKKEEQIEAVNIIDV